MAKCTSKNNLISLGLSKPINDAYRWDMDTNANTLSSTPASGGVTATAGTAVEYFLSTRLLVLLHKAC